MNKTLLLAGAACLFSMNAMASDFNYCDMRATVGMDYTYSNADIEKVDGINAFKNSLNSGAINAGIKFNRYMGIEAFYQQSENGTKTVLNDIKTKSKFDAYGADVIGYMPVHDKIDLLGSVGLAQYETNATIMDYSEVAKASEDGLGVRFGLGAQYNVTENWGLRAMARYNWLDLDNVNHITELSAGVRYTF